MSVMLALAAEFATVIRNDPITLEKQAIFAVMEGQDTFGLACRPGRNEIKIVFIPEYYRGAARGGAFWSPRADSRFGAQAAPEKDAWFFDDRSLVFVGSASFSDEVGAKARFIDRLARDNEFNIRWESYPDDSRTLTISYSIAPEQLRNFVAECGPKRVIAKLREMGSPAAP